MRTHLGGLAGYGYPGAEVSTCHNVYSLSILEFPKLFWATKFWPVKTPFSSENSVLHLNLIQLHNLKTTRTMHKSVGI